MNHLVEVKLLAMRYLLRGRRAVTISHQRAAS